MQFQLIVCRFVSFVVCVRFDEIEVRSDYMRVVLCSVCTIRILMMEGVLVDFSLSMFCYGFE